MVAIVVALVLLAIVRAGVSAALLVATATLVGVVSVATIAILMRDLQT